ncbi:serine/threonine-protein kinase [soil metagenome]
MIAGRYSRDREIGRGGMGAVWLGRDEVLGRPVAIKRIGVVAPGDSGPDLARAEREAKIAASLNHPHIVGVFDLVAEDEQHWMIMEYVQGTTLSELVRTNGPLSHDEAARIIAQAASALAAAHANGVVHRDVKPSNILVREDGHVKLTDFGIARGQADAALTQTGLVTGSPAYLAPEVASGQHATPASDVWSLGATLFHALAGHPPYDASDNLFGALYRIVNEAPPRIADAGALAPLLEASMTRSPEQRWTMAEIERFLTGGEGGHREPPIPAPEAGSGPPPTERLHVVPGMSEQAPPPATPATGMRRAEPGRRALLPALITLVVAILVVAVIVLALQDDPQDNLAQDPGSDAPATTTPSPSATSTDPDPSSPTSEPSGVPTKKAMKSFIGSYLSLASSDPTRAFQLLTPAFQRKSPRYDEFWGSVSNPQLLEFSADPSALTVSYTYRYQRRGLGRQVDPVQLQLVATDDGGFLIDGPL